MLITKIRKKIRNKQGMTLLETLITTAMVALVSAAIAIMIPNVINAYEKTVLRANADVLLSTTVRELRNELGLARKVSKDGTSVSFYNEELNSEAKILLASAGDADYEAGTILYQRYTNGDASKGYLQTDPLLSGKGFSEQMYVTYDSVDLEGAVVTFRNLKVVTPSHSTPLAMQGQVSVRTGG